MRYKLFSQCACKHCGQDIENHGRGQWLDRGGNRGCAPFFDKKKGEFVRPKSKHAPAK